MFIRYQYKIEYALLYIFFLTQRFCNIARFIVAMAVLALIVISSDNLWMAYKLKLKTKMWVESRLLAVYIDFRQLTTPNIQKCSITYILRYLL